MLTMRRAAMLALMLAAVPAAPAQAQGTCAPPGMSGQCNELGTILMDFQRDVQGSPIDVTARITLDNNHRDQARAFLFSVRNVSGEAGSPVSVELKGFATTSGPVVTQKVERPGPHEVNLWVDVLDVPVGQPIDLTVTVGSSERGAYRLEVLVMPFDRAYMPLRSASGTDLSLFAFTLLGVNRETGDASTGATERGIFDSNSVGRRLPGPEPAWALAVLGAAALVAARKRS